MNIFRRFWRRRQHVPVVQAITEVATGYIAAKCGHFTQIEGNIEAFGKTGKVKMPLNEVGGVDYCLECVGQMAIRCAWCKEVIWIGEPITLYTPMEAFEVPEGAIIYNQDPLQLVGCLGWNCADTGADRAGFWLPGDGGKGVVYRVISGVEEAMMTQEISIVGDLSNISDAVERQKRLSQI